MDQKRFISFKTDLRQVISNIIKDGNPEFVEAQFKALAEVYPELKDGASLPDLVVRVNTMPMDGVEVNVKTEERLSSTAIKEKLLTSMTDTRFVNYDGYQPKLDNEESCVIVGLLFVLRWRPGIDLAQQDSVTLFFIRSSTVVLELHNYPEEKQG